MTERSGWRNSPQSEAPWTCTQCQDLHNFGTCTQEQANEATWNMNIPGTATHLNLLCGGKGKVGSRAAFVMGASALQRQCDAPGVFVAVDARIVPTEGVIMTHMWVSFF